MKAEKNEKSGKRTVEAAKACLNHINSFKKFQTFWSSVVPRKKRKEH